MDERMRPVVEGVAAWAADDDDWNAAVERAASWLEDGWPQDMWSEVVRFGLETLSLFLYMLDRRGQRDDVSVHAEVTSYLHREQLEPFRRERVHTAKAIDATCALFVSRLPEEGSLRDLLRVLTLTPEPHHPMVEDIPPMIRGFDTRMPLAPALEWLDTPLYHYTPNAPPQGA